MLRRVINCPAARSGRRVLFPLLCAVVLLLLLSGCSLFGGDKPSQTTADHDDATGTQKEETTPEVSVLTAKDLNSKERNALTQLSRKVSDMSKAVEDLKSEVPQGKKNFDDVLSSAETWLNTLKEFTSSARNAFESHYGEDFNAKAPGLTEFENRLNTMSKVIRRNQTDPPKEIESLQKFEDLQDLLDTLKRWFSELTERAEALPALPDASASESESDSETSTGSDSNAPTGSDSETSTGSDTPITSALDADFETAVNNKLDGISSNLDKLSGLPGIASQILERVNGVKQPPYMILFVALLISIAVILALVLWIRSLMTNKSDENKNAILMTNKSDENKNAILKQLNGRHDALDKRLSSLESAVQKLQTSGATSTQEPYTPPPVNPLETPTPMPFPNTKPEIAYFTVKTPAAGFQKACLEKLPKGRRSDICGQLIKENPQQYEIVPKMLDITDGGKHGTIAANVLYNGDIQECFEIPKQRPQGDVLKVTVTTSAIVQWTGQTYQLMRKGELDVRN